VVGSEWWAIDLLYSQSSRAVHITLPYHTNKQARAADRMVGCPHKGIRRHAVHTTLPYHTNKQALQMVGNEWWAAHIVIRRRAVHTSYNTSLSHQ
jgi:hypothetical protein